MSSMLKVARLARETVATMGLRTSAFIVGVLLLDCSLCALRKPPLLPSSFSPHEQAAVGAAWTAIDHRRCTNWSNGFHYNVSVVLFPSCLPSSPWNKDADEKKGCIPRIVHQTWKTKEPPPRWQSLVGSSSRCPPLSSCRIMSAYQSFLRPSGMDGCGLARIHSSGAPLVLANL